MDVWHFAEGTDAISYVPVFDLNGEVVFDAFATAAVGALQHGDDLEECLLVFSKVRWPKTYLVHRVLPSAELTFLLQVSNGGIQGGAVMNSNQGFI